MAGRYMAGQEMARVRTECDSTKRQGMVLDPSSGGFWWLRFRVGRKKRKEPSSICP